MNKIAYPPLEEAQRLSEFFSSSKYKQYGNDSYVVYYPGDLLKADRIIAVLKGISIFSNGVWKLKVHIKFHEQQYIKEQRVLDFLDIRKSELAAQGGELKVA